MDVDQELLGFDQKSYRYSHSAESLEKSTKKEALSPSKKAAPKWEDDRHPRSRSRTGDRDKAREKDWEMRGETTF